MEQIDANSRRSDSWTNFLSFVTAATPVLVLVIGYLLNAGINEQKAAIEKQRGAIEDLKTAAETESVYARTKIDKAKVISDFLNDLTGKDPVRQRVALTAIQFVLPADEAEKILQAVQQSSPESKTAQEAGKILEDVRRGLIDGVFSPDRSKRAAALQTLKRDRSNDELLVKELLVRASVDVAKRAAIGFPARKFGDPDYQPLASISNTAEFLTTANVSDPDLVKAILEFAEAAKRNSADTQGYSDRIKERFSK